MQTASLADCRGKTVMVCHDMCVDGLGVGRSVVGEKEWSVGYGPIPLSSSDVKSLGACYTWA